MKTTNNILMTSSEKMSKEEAIKLINHAGTIFYPDTPENKKIISECFIESLNKFKKKEAIAKKNRSERKELESLREWKKGIAA